MRIVATVGSWYGREVEFGAISDDLCDVLEY